MPTKRVPSVLATLLAFDLIAPVRAAASSVPASAAEARPLATGARAPVVTLKTVDEADFALGTAFAEKPTVLVFYRGNWCPFCNRQLAALGELELQFLALGYQILTVSPDTAPGLRQMAGKNHLNYRLPPITTWPPPPLARNRKSLRRPRHRTHPDPRRRRPLAARARRLPRRPRRRHQVRLLEPRL